MLFRSGDGTGKGHGSAGHDEAHEHGDDQTLAQEAFELRMVLCAVVVADDRRDGDGIAEEKCLEDEVDVDVYKRQCLTLPLLMLQEPQQEMRESSEDLRPQPQRSRRCRMRPVKKGTGFRCV